MSTSGSITTTTEDAAHQAEHAAIIKYVEGLWPLAIGRAIKSAFEHVLDGEEDLSDLEACEKTQLGTTVEKRFLKQVRLPVKYSPEKMKRLATEGIDYSNPLLDTVINGVDVDIKHTIHDNWMIPLEAINRWCLLFKTDYRRGVYSLGLIKASPDNLTANGNRDKKVSVSKAGKSRITWIVKDHRLTDAADA